MVVTRGVNVHNYNRRVRITRPTPLKRTSGAVNSTNSSSKTNSKPGSQSPSSGSVDKPEESLKLDANSTNNVDSNVPRAADTAVQEQLSLLPSPVPRRRSASSSPISHQHHTNTDDHNKSNNSKKHDTRPVRFAATPTSSKSNLSPEHKTRMANRARLISSAPSIKRTKSEGDDGNDEVETIDVKFYIFLKKKLFLKFFFHHTKTTKGKWK